MGRRSKFTAEVRTRILDALRLGATREHAAAFAGITARTFYNWMSQAASETHGGFLQFFQDVKKAEGENTVAMLQVIHDAAKSDWRAAAWCLERCRGFTRTNALRPSVEHANDDKPTQDREAAVEMLMDKLEALRRRGT